MAGKKAGTGRGKSEELPHVVPTLPGQLNLREIATLAGVKLTTMRTYRQSKVSNFPEPASHSAGIPFWNQDEIIEWLASRQYSRTLVEKHADGSLRVVRPSDYHERKAKGEIGSAQK